MGKRREASEDDTKAASSSSPKKKHKHKHKKHKKKDKRDHGDHDDHGHRRERKERDKEEKKGGLKLKIKLGGQTVTTTEVTKILPMEDVISSAEEEDVYQPSWPVSEIEEVDEDVDEEEVDIEADVPTDLDLDVDESSKSLPDVDVAHDELEEQRWLDALEAGELDDYGRLKQEKDISTMTARQRAMLGHEIAGENQLVELPTETRRREEDTEEAQRRRKQRAKKRKQQMEKQIEENKAQTVQKLLTKQATRSKKDKEVKKKDKLEGIPRVTYTSNASGIKLSFPSGFDFPLERKRGMNQLPRSKPKCAVKCCNNFKKYSCSKTKLPICSLECYKKIQSLYKSPKTLTAAV